MEKFKDPQFRKEVYEHILKQLYKMKSGKLKKLPFMCHIVAEKYMKELGDYEVASEAMLSLSGYSEPIENIFGKIVTPLHHLLPELQRPELCTKYSSWYLSDDVNSRILNCEAALEKLKSKLP